MQIYGQPKELDLSRKKRKQTIDPIDPNASKRSLVGDSIVHAYSTHVSIDGITDVVNYGKWFYIISKSIKLSLSLSIGINQFCSTHHIENLQDYYPDNESNYFRSESRQIERQLGNQPKINQSMQQPHTSTYGIRMELQTQQKQIPELQTSESLPPNNDSKDSKPHNI